MTKEARALRQVLRVNGSKPRKNDYKNCTTPEQEDSEEQPLSMLLAESRSEFTFEYDGRDAIDGRDAVIIVFRERKVRPTVTVSVVEDNENCISFDIDGGMRGKLWIDAETNDVLRLDRSLIGLVDIPLPRKTDLVSIEASDLHPEPQQKNLLVLAATLKNRAPFVQEYPHLEVTLTDTRDQPMVRRVFAPAEYLAEGANVRAGFAANGDLAVNLWLDTGNVGASGYRLYLFYP